MIEIHSSYYNAWIESFPNPGESSLDEDDDSVDYEDDSTSSSASSSDDDDDEGEESENESEGEMEESVLIEFHSESDSKAERDSDPENEDVFEFSADFSSSGSSMMIGTHQLEANIMDLSPREFRRYNYKQSYPPAPPTSPTHSFN